MLSQVPGTPEEPPAGPQPGRRLEDRLDALGEQIDGQLDELYPPSPAPQAVQALLAQAAFRGQLTETQMRALSRRVHDTLTAPVRHLIEAGGQRWRHGLMLVAIDALGGDGARFAPLAAAVEGIHTGSLIVDDVQDAAVLRRGRPAAHQVFGLPTALNAGTAAYFAFDTAIRRTAADDPPLRAALYEAYSGVLRAAHAGQALDLQGHSLEVEQALRSGCNRSLAQVVLLTHRLKSGVVVGASLEMAGLVSGANAETCAALYAFGAAVGTAYQIADDIADLDGVCRGGQATKSVGEDLHNGKVTVPFVHAVALAPQDAGQMWRWVAHGRATAQQVERAITMLHECGAVQASTSEADTVFAAGWQQLDVRLPASREKELVHDMAWWVVNQHRVA
ncbi:polyprenyl synthetase family protein [Streptomyces sp. NPDC048483]|uniref:polyprenyl synthetase family protein n=1 Tax=Streptomyces sp. NPDC048483 TaxID=3154927 RepID=UPI0034267C35